MKKNILFASMVAVMAVACQKESVETAIEDGSKTKTITVNAAMETNADSRVNIDTDAWVATWEAGDKLYAVHSYTNNEESYYYEHFTIVDGFEPTLASFTGEISTSTNMNEVRFYHSKNNQRVSMVSPLSFTIDYAEQDGSLNKTVLINDSPFKVSELTDNLTLTPTMQHSGGYMSVNISFNNFVEGYTLTELRYCNVPTSATIAHNSSVDEMVVSETLGNITIKLAEPIEITGDNITVDLNIIPFEVAQDDQIVVKLSLQKDDKSYEAEITKQNTSGGVLSFERAKHSTTNIICDMSADIVEFDYEGTQIYMSYFDSSNSGYDFSRGPYDDLAIASLPESDTWVILDGSISQFNNLFYALGTADIVNRYIKLEFPNLTELTATFGGMSSPRYMSMPKLTTVSYTQFAACSAYLEYIHIPSVTSIGQGAFAGCSLITEFDLPVIETLEIDAFYGCTGLKTVNLATAEGAKLISFSANVFRDVPTENVTLTIGDYDPDIISISGNTLSVTGTEDSCTFLEIIQQ